MKVLIVLCAIVCAALAKPSGYGSSSSYHAHQTPVVLQVAQAPSQAYAVSVPVAATNIYAPAAPEVVRPIVTGTLYLTQDTAGQYEFGYSSSDGQDKQESKPAGGDISGKFSYTSPEGQDIKLEYTAGEEGFKAEGDHLPKEVELPEELAEAYREANERLEKAHEEAKLRGDTAEDDGSYKQGESESEGEGAGKGSEGGEGGEGGDNGGKSEGSSSGSSSSGHQQVQQQHVVYAQVQAPVRYARVEQVVQAPVHYAAAIPSYQVAPKVEVKQEEEQEEEKSAPVVYSSSSYQTEIGGPVAVAVAQEVVQEAAAPAPAPAPAPSHKKSGYSSNGY